MMSETTEQPASPEALALAKAVMGKARELGEVMANHPLIRKLAHFKDLCQDPDPDKLLVGLAEKSRDIAARGPGFPRLTPRTERMGMCQAIGVLYGAEALRVAEDLCRIFDKLYSGEVQERPGLD